jgi:hypothetical protein
VAHAEIDPYSSSFSSSSRRPLKERSCSSSPPPLSYSHSSSSRHRDSPASFVESPTDYRRSDEGSGKRGGRYEEDYGRRDRQRSKDRERRDGKPDRRRSERGGRRVSRAEYEDDNSVGFSFFFSPRQLPVQPLPLLSDVPCSPPPSSTIVATVPLALATTTATTAAPPLLLPAALPTATVPSALTPALARRPLLRRITMSLGSPALLRLLLLRPLPISTKIRSTAPPASVTLTLVEPVDVLSRRRRVLSGCASIERRSGEEKRLRRRGRRRREDGRGGRRAVEEDRGSSAFSSLLYGVALAENPSLFRRGEVGRGKNAFFVCASSCFCFAPKPPSARLCVLERAKTRLSRASLRELLRCPPPLSLLPPSHH